MDSTDSLRMEEEFRTQSKVDTDAMENEEPQENEPHCCDSPSVCCYFTFGRPISACASFVNKITSCKHK